jgi:hypothetical protein
MINKKEFMKVVTISAICILVYSYFIATYLGRIYPVIGHDFSVFIPRLTDIYIHYLVNGPTIQWFSPSFGGGLPAYANPQHIQFSLPQLITIFFDPWQSIIISIIIYIALGYIGGYLFFKKVIGLNWTTSILASLLFLINGFFIMHMSVGHLSFISFTLLPLILYFLFRQNSGWLIEATTISIILGSIIYGAGFHVSMIFIFTSIIFLPLLYFFKSELFEWKTLLTRISVSLLLTLGITASKLGAVYSLMKIFPREIFFSRDISWAEGIISIVGQLLGTMTLAPIYWLVTRNLLLYKENIVAMMRGNSGLWEIDIALSPLLWGILILGIFLFIKDVKQHKKINKKQWISLGILLVASMLIVNIILANNPVYSVFKTLPVFKSLGITLRYTAAFIFPLVLLGALSYERFIYKFKSSVREILLCLAIITVFVFLIPYYRIPPAFVGQWFNGDQLIQQYQRIKAGSIPQIDQIAEINDWDSFENNASSISPHDPLYGNIVGNYHSEITAGSIYTIEDGYYNMNNPVGFIYPELNNTHPYERIKVDEKDKLLDFTNYKQPDWKIPQFQYILNIISLITVIAVGLIIIYFSYKRMIQSFGKK